MERSEDITTGQTGRVHDHQNRILELAGIGLMAESGFVRTTCWPKRPRPILLARLKTSPQIWVKYVEGSPSAEFEEFLEELDKHAKTLLQRVELADTEEPAYWPLSVPQERTLASQLVHIDLDA